MAHPRNHPDLRSKRMSSRKAGCLFTVLFGGVFATAGTAMFIFFTVLPLWHIYEARGWVATPCTITHSDVKTHSDSDGSTYSIDIRYSYQVNGKTYQSDRYYFAPPGSSSGYKGKRKAVDAHPVGSEQTCYVDPDDPSRSVIQRGMTAALWWGLFPIPFMAVGYGVIYAGLTGKINFQGRGGESGWRPAGMDTGHGGPSAAGASALSWTDGDGDKPIVLDPGRNRKTHFIGIGIFALIWNGILGVIAYGFLSDIDRESGGFQWVPALFLTPFLIAGLVMVFFAVRNLMLMFAPRIVIELGRDTLPLGGSTLLRWHVADARKRVEQVRIQLVGEEQATYQRGTNTSTDTEAFFESWVLGDDPGAPRRAVGAMVSDHGDLVLEVPSDSMHTFEANNNKIVWKLIVHAEVARWPDPKDEYELTILPIPVETHGGGNPNP